jgi:hypothetical protein
MLSEREILKRQFPDLPSPPPHFLHPERDPAEYHDVSVIVVDILLYAGTEGTDRRSRVAVLQDLPA